MNRFLAAVAFLTRVPVRRAFDGKDVGRSTLFFPLVGAGLGLFRVGVWKAMSFWLPSLLSAVLIVTASIWVTRAIHLDGLGDFVDGLAGGRTRERVLEIMGDSRIGAFGAIAIVLLVAVDVAALEALQRSSSIAPALVLASTLSRWTALPLASFLPYARAEGGLGEALTGHVGKVELVGATVLAAGLVAFFDLRLIAALWGAVLVVTLLVAWIARSRVGGVTGDILGANVELSEAATLVLAVGMTR